MSESLDQLIGLLEAETIRLKANLESVRLLSSPAREQLIQRLVCRIDEREGRLGELRKLRAELGRPGP